ncbi:hypothetical protein QAD02_017996 [Eretmocerus hayati]|uniref:Uncharacterized protein n=1 Tax=Eretmocerus hayati TaxID=131215 RepID=A0ACC2PHY2_9HYME|nr:hypothetical protein QAD02_017996 [Eretmocerus hayati]
MIANWQQESAMSNQSENQLSLAANVNESQGVKSMILERHDYIKSENKNEKTSGVKRSSDEPLIAGNKRAILFSAPCGGEIPGSITKYQQQAASQISMELDTPTTPQQSIPQSISSCETNSPRTSDDHQRDNHSSPKMNAPTSKLKFTKFSETDAAPYKIIIQNKDHSRRRIDPLLINRDLILKYKGTSFQRTKPTAYNKMVVSTMDREIANKILADTEEWDKKGLEAFIPNHQMVVQGIIRNVSVEVSEEELLQNLEVYSYFQKLEVLGVRRFTKKVFNKTTNQYDTIKKLSTIQFTLKGQYLPKKPISTK